MSTFKKIAAVGVALMLALPAQASSIFLAGDSNIFTTNADNEVFFQNVFNGKTVSNYSDASLNSLGTTASVISYGSYGAVTAASLAGADFMLFGYNRTGVSASELTAITDFYNNGGSLFLFGEGATSFNSLNGVVNSVLAAVGSSMSLSLNAADNLDTSGFTTFNVTGATPFANGVNTWTTAYASGINLGSGTAVISGQGDNKFGVAIALEDGSQPSPVPLPGGLPLAASAIALFGILRKRKQAA